MLQERFPATGFLFPHSETVIATLEAPHPALGELVIEDDGDLAIATIGDITHAHFYAFDRKHPYASKEVAEHLGDFLAKLFADEIYLWNSAGSTGHGPMAKKRPKPKRGRSYFLWSGPYVPAG